MNPLRISDIGDFRIMGKANTLSAQLKNIAARHSFINQSEEARAYQDVDATADFYKPGISKEAL